MRARATAALPLSCLRPASARFPLVHAVPLRVSGRTLSDAITTIDKQLNDKQLKKKKREELKKQRQVLVDKLRAGGEAAAARAPCFERARAAIPLSPTSNTCALDSLW